MNYNANTGARPPFGRKVKRVSDVNSMGYNPYEQGNNQPNVYPDLSNSNTGFQQMDYSNPAPGYAQDFGQNKQPQTQIGYHYNQPAQQAPYLNPVAPQMPNILGQAAMQGFALQYGEQLAGVGKERIQKEVERYVPVSKLKYYFAVDTSYVLTKLVLLFFPFTHKDWSIKYEQDGPVQPRFEINAPDLYIPTMAYITYVLTAGMVLGMQERFSPEQLGILASSALAWCIVELVVYSCTLYLIHVETSLRTLDLLAYSGYKFVGTIMSIAVYMVAGKTGYYAGLVYANLALAFFLIRSLKAQVLSEPNAQQQNSYYGEQPVSGSKRRLYFLLFVAGTQPVLSWWLSFHLLSGPAPKLAPVGL